MTKIRRAVTADHRCERTNTFVLALVLIPLIAVTGCGGGSTDEATAADGVRHILPISPWTRNAYEGESFTVDNKTVRYGSGSIWVQKKVKIKGDCTDRFFGGDPLRLCNNLLA